MEMKKTLLVAALSGAIAGSLMFAMPLYLDKQGYDLSEIGWIFGIATFVSGILGVGIGALSDRFGRRPLISLYNLMAGIGAFIVVGITNIYGFIIGKAIRDYSATQLWGAYVSRIGDITENRKRGESIGKFALVYGSVFSIMFFATGWILDSYGFTVLFSIVIVLSIVAAALTFIFREAGKRTNKTEFSLGMLKTRNGIVNSLVSFCTGSADGLIYAYFIYIFLINEFSFTISGVGALITGVFILWALSSYFAGKTVDRFGIKKTAVTGALVVASTWIMQAFFWSELWIFVFLLAVENIFWGFYGTSATKLSSIIPKKENLGRDVAVFTYAHITGVMFGVTIAGMLAEISYMYLFIANAIVMASTALLVSYGIKLKE